ncbi:MAG TPA: phosphoenolpyruvate--protein phosphotransferase [Planctomycetaceae bacterium]|nr:phosphoenolpyruvate--protein phosphotransferase [Planctomycetaceae bacterium]
MRKGIAVSPGVTIGTAYCIHEVFVDPSRGELTPDEIPGELARFDNARKRSIADLQALRQKVEKQVNKEASAIFAVHESILLDATLVGKVRTDIRDRQLTAQAALANLLEHYRSVFESAKDAYLRERFADIRDVVERLTSYLSDALKKDSGALDGPTIVIADELLPSQVVMLGDKPVHGIVTQAGGQTSHAAIVARSRGIPAVSGVAKILRSTKTGDTVVVDGREGHVIINPDPEVLAAYRKLEREFFDLRDALAHNRDAKAVTKDGVSISLLANINGPSDSEAAKAMGASGIGLYRTEYLYLTHASVPGEEEQLEIYKSVIGSGPGGAVTIRTLDIGGDKTVPFLGREQVEANPFMGWRSIRLSFEHPKFFLTQIRAILRAAAPSENSAGEVETPDVKMMFPMVTNLEELRRLRSFVRKAEQQLAREKLPFGKAAFGMMLEVPAAAVMIDQLLSAVDFVSIGSNDLVQYLMAADRDNPKVSHLCQPLSPAVLRVLHSVVKACNERKKPVTLCGEMAGQPQAFAVLLGMGLRRFSMSPAFVPTVKELATHLTIPMAEQLLTRVLRQTTTSRVKTLLNRELARIAPKLSPILMQ